MQIEPMKNKGWSVITLDGRLDAITAPDLEKQCGLWVDDGHRHVLLNMAPLEYISSAGLRVILSTAKKLKGLGGSLAVCGMGGMVKEVFALSAFDTIIPSYDTADAAPEQN
jgi:anti-anti-sigma factor